MNLINNAAEKIAERLSWHTATRDQAAIAKDIADGKDIKEIYVLGEAGLFDDFFCFLDQFGLTKLFLRLEPKSKKRESPVSFSAAIYIYLMRIVAGLQFFWHIDPVVLHSQSLMRLVGFNGRDVREGTCARGNKKSPQANPGEKQPTKIRGPVCPEFISSFIVAITGAALEKLFNGVIKILAAHSFFPKNIHAILDASEIQSSERCKGRGRVQKEKAPSLRNRKSRIRKVYVTVFGFKIWVVWDHGSRLPLSMRFAKINVNDTQFAKEVIEQAITNLAGQAEIVSIALDRGFTDGKLLWWLNQKGIIFYMPAKSDMNVYEDAISLIKGGVVAQRKRERYVGSGRNKKTVLDRWEVVGIEELTSAGFYGELGSGSHENRKDFVANPINAVVVVQDPYKEKNPDCKTMVILTDDSVKKPLKVYDGYDDRSKIENSLFREAKQAWFIQRPPRNTIGGFRAHAYLTIITMALTGAFQAWMEQQEKLEKGGQDIGIRKFREKVKEENGNKLIIFDEDRYAIFDAYEVLILGGQNVSMPRGVPEKITKDDILIKYGVHLE